MQAKVKNEIEIKISIIGPADELKDAFGDKMSIKL